MKKLTIFAILLMSLNASAQRFETKKDRNKFIAVATLQGLSGAARGFEQVLVNHYECFEYRHPNANSQFWDNRISWENKYKNNDEKTGKPKYFGSTTFLVATTDGKHLADLVSNWSCYASVSIPLSGINKTTIKKLSIQTAGIVVARAIGFNLIYHGIYNKSN